VNLRDGGRGDRASGKLSKERPQRLAKVALNGLSHVAEGERPDVVLQALESLDDVGGQQIGASRHDLPDLDERSAQVAKERKDAVAKVLLSLGSATAAQAPSQPTHSVDHGRAHKKKEDYTRAAKQAQRVQQA
jgi:hypothetical protein